MKWKQLSDHHPDGAWHLYDDDDQSGNTCGQVYIGFTQGPRLYYATTYFDGGAHWRVESIEQGQEQVMTRYVAWRLSQ